VGYKSQCCKQRAYSDCKSSSATPGTVSVTVTGTSGVLTATTTLVVTIHGPAFTLSDSPGILIINQGSSGTSTIAVTPEDRFVGNVSLAASGLPSGVTASWGTNPTAGSSVLTLTASSSAAPGAVNVTITGTSGALTSITTLALRAIGPRATTTATLAVTSADSPVTSIASGNVVTMTASVQAGATAVTTGLVNFCDATAAYCTDIHRLGTTQLTSAGTAVLKLVPGIGSHSYKAVFLGTILDSASLSSASMLTVTGTYSTSTAIASSGGTGNYTLTATVTGQGSASPTGIASFPDTSNGNYVLGAVPLSPDASAPVLSFFNSSTRATSPYPQSVAVADFNGDGKPDLAVPVYSMSTPLSDVTLLLGNGDGTFTAGPTVPATGQNVNNVAVADFKGDGNADIALSLPDANQVQLLLGNGDGTFTAIPAIPAGEVYDVEAADLNGDGNADLIAIICATQSLSILLDNGDGTFTQASSLGVGGCPSSVAVGDFNGDGISDLAVVITATTSAIA